MAENASLVPPIHDAFSPIAAYYDTLMAHVDYSRWQYVVRSLATIAPKPLTYLDTGCGTGTLLALLSNEGWMLTGTDLSWTMLNEAKSKNARVHWVQSNFCQLPFREHFSLITCLFDSMNFLLEEEEILQALTSFYEALRPSGILYFDVVTRQMIKKHFNNEAWHENHGSFSSSWQSTFDRSKQICTTHICIDSGTASVTYERIFPEEFLREAIQKAGLTLLAVRDAYSWKKPTRTTTRIDFVAAKEPTSDIQKRFSSIDRSLHSKQNDTRL